MVSFEDFLNSNFPTFKKHSLRVIEKWSGLPSHKKTILKLLPIFLILAAIPLTVNLSQKQQNVNTNAVTSTSLIYGSGIGMDSLNNTTIGPYGSVSSYRFRATTTSLLNSIRIYIVGKAAGYASGTGGTLEVSVQTDDATSNHGPSGTVISSVSIPNASSLDGLPLITFPAPATLNAGQLYHIVFRNTDPSPSTNFVSLDGIFMYQPTVPRQPLFSDVDWGQPLKYASNGWQDRPNTIPILQLNYADGTKAGLGYMEVWVRSYKIISGSGMAREAFTVSGSDKTVSSATVRIMRDSGTSPLTVRLETSNGTLIEQGTIPSSSIAVGTPGDNGGGSTWATYTFSAPHALSQGQSYNLVLSAPSDTQYSIFVIRKGVEYQFAPTTHFSEGYAQYNTGTGWVAFDQDGGARNLDEGDLQFYFALATGATPTPTPTVAVSTPTPTSSTTFSITSGPSVSSITNTGATITWYLSDYGTGQVEYGTTSNYGLYSTPETSFNWNYHSQNLSGLLPGTTYHYRVKSTNKSGITVTSSDNTFTTTGGITLTLTPTPTFTPTPTLKPTNTPTPTPIPPTPTPAASTLGNGLLGMYYSNRFLSGSILYRVDPSINFNWGKDSPMPGIGPNNFSIRWTGYILPKYSEIYTFYAQTDDGVRVWVNNVLVIDSWFDHSATTEYSGRISLSANKKYSIKVEYYEKNVYSSARISWSSPSTPKTIIPQSQLFTYY